YETFGIGATRDKFVGDAFQIVRLKCRRHDGHRLRLRKPDVMVASTARLPSSGVSPHSQAALLSSCSATFGLSLPSATISANRHAAQYSRSLRVPRGAVSTTRRMRSTRRGVVRVGSQMGRWSPRGFS